MRRIRRILAALLIIGPFLYSASVHAQPTTVYEKGDWNARLSVAKSALGTTHSPDPNTGRIQSSPEGSRAMRGREALCPGGGNCISESDAERALANIQPDLRSRPINIYGPMSGFADTMYSQMHANQLSTILSSPVVLYNTTMMLTEPAVAAAVQNSAMFALGSVQSRYQAESTMLHSLENQPDTRELVWRAYQECIATYIRFRDVPGGSDGEQDLYSWIEAQSQCMGDRLKSIDVSWNGTNFNQLGASVDGTGFGFDFRMDPHHPINWPSGASGGIAPDPHFIRMTDYLFNATNWQALGLSPTDIFQLKNDFRRILGDYEFSLDQPDSTTGYRSSSREIKYRKVPPDFTLDEWYGQKYQEVFNTIVQMVVDQCSHNPGNDPFAAGAIACRPGNSSFTETNFVAVSANGYQFNCSMVQMLLLRFRSDFPEVKSGQCGAISANPAGLFGNPGAVSSGHRAIALIASKVSLAQIYAAAMTIDQVIKSLTSTSGLDGYVKLYASQLLTSALGTDNLTNEYVAILNSINNEFRPEMQALAAKDVKGAGQIGVSIATEHAADGTGELSAHQ